ncbi:MAG: SPOR domain-containing protein [Thermodesulfobacteriota bacterium]
MKRNLSTGSANLALLILVVVLAVAAGIAGWFILSPPSGDNQPREITAEIINQPRPAPARPRVTQQLTPEELQARQVSKTLAEFSGPLDRPAKDWLVYSGSGQDVRPRPEQSDLLAAVRPTEIEVPPAQAQEPTPPSLPEDQPPESSGTTTGGKPTTPEPTPAEAVDESAPTFSAEKAEPPGSSDQAKVYVVNVLSTQEPEKASTVLDKLSKAGYKVYQYETEVNGRKWLRVRLGFFASKDEAEKVGRKLAAEHNLPEPWIVTPGPQELARFRDQTPLPLGADTPRTAPPRPPESGEDYMSRTNSIYWK